MELLFGVTMEWQLHCPVFLSQIPMLLELEHDERMEVAKKALLIASALRRASILVCYSSGTRTRGGSASCL